MRVMTGELDLAEEAMWLACATACGLARIERLLTYLSVYPRGRHNRRATEAVEDLLFDLRPTLREELMQRLRSLRAPHLGPLGPRLA
ncbi:MAG: hypothetical protein KF901_11965 [Myxococcales bacterium]|nr:hypothetical protein [Myxococcales bacterium]